MEPREIIRGRRVLVVDDEKDVLDTLVELLSACKIDSALTFEEGKRLLESNGYEIVVLDIMGVNGFELLRIANDLGIPTVMLTAHGISESNLKRSAEMGASYYVPKDEMERIDVFIADVLEALEMNKSPWVRWFERLGGFYDRKFGGPNWREKERRFWENKISRIGEG